MNAEATSLVSGRNADGSDATYFFADEGFPVDSSPCIYLIFLFHSFSRSLISYFAWLVCGRSHIIGTWVDRFFPGAGVDKKIGDGVFSLP